MKYTFEKPYYYKLVGNMFATDAKEIQLWVKNQ